MKIREEKLRPYSINTTGADMTLELLSKKLDEGDIIVPEFQRNQVWNIKKASRLIESFLLGLPIPQIFLYKEKKTNELLVVDGQQRLRSINAFFRGQYGDRIFRLTDINSEWDGLTYEEMSGPDKRTLKNAILRSTIFEQVHPDDTRSVLEVFERLNTGGMSLTPQEVRNAVIGGDLNNLIKELNEYSPWRQLFGKNKTDLRQRDTEAILRILALNDNSTEYKKPMYGYLDGYLYNKKVMSATEITRVRKTFTEVIDVILDRIGEKAFRPKTSFSQSVAESVFIGVARNFSNLPKDLSGRFCDLVMTQDFIDATEQHTTDAEKVEMRIGLAIKMFEDEVQ